LSREINIVEGNYIKESVSKGQYTRSLSSLSLPVLLGAHFKNTILTPTSTTTKTQCF
jgi:hypothetical protein